MTFKELFDKVQKKGLLDSEVCILDENTEKAIPVKGITTIEQTVVPLCDEDGNMISSDEVEEVPVLVI